MVNYPNEEDFTRITEFKKLTGQALPGRTVILREYPAKYQPNTGMEATIPLTRRRAMPCTSGTGRNLPAMGTSTSADGWQNTATTTWMPLWMRPCV